MKASESGEWFFFFYNVLDRAGLTGILVEAILAAKKRGQEMENY